MADPNDSIAYLRSLVERMPENKDLPKPQFFMDPRSLSMANILKGGATNTLNWFDAVRGSGQEAKPGEGYGFAATGLTPEDVVVPTGIGAMGLKALTLREGLDRPSIADSARARYLEWKHPDDLPTVTGGGALHPDSATQMANADKIRSWPNPAIKDAAYPTQKPYDADHTIANERGTPRDRFRLLADNAQGSTPGLLLNSLPMDEASRLNRAREQGYTIDAYKGGYPFEPDSGPATNYKGEVIKGTENNPLIPIETLDNPNKPYAGFFSNSPDVANRFADHRFFDNPVVWPTKLKMENPLEIDAGGRHAAAFQFDSIAKREGTLDQMEAFHKAFEEGTPYDGVILRNTKDEGDVYVPRSGHQVRSRYAAFDPDNIGKSGLLLSDQSRASVPGTVVNAQEERSPTLAEILMRGSY
jgi:hypothetical protein